MTLTNEQLLTIKRKLILKKYGDIFDRVFVVREDNYNEELDDFAEYRTDSSKLHMIDMCIDMCFPEMPWWEEEAYNNKITIGISGMRVDITPWMFEDIDNMFKSLEKGNRTCVVCYEPQTPLHMCPTCSNTVCFSCSVNIFISLKGVYKCPCCRTFLPISLKLLLDKCICHMKERGQKIPPNFLVLKDICDRQ